ncbi:MAG: 1-(5-phosphoribosyl)-5-[(5-phosphoribosylamino)methylideneamino]imidazole-4-carboxamide isomerase, partial [Ignavibacteriaceae bacterium]
MIIIPAIDIYDNQIVRLTKGDFDNITYYKNSPLQQAQLYESMGFDLIHIVDLLGSKTGKFTAVESVNKIKDYTKLQIEFGGGIRDVKTAAELFSAGVDYAIIGSLAIKNKNEFELIIKQNGADKIVAAIDVEDEKIKISGWTEETSISVYSHIEYCLSLGIQKFLCTDISKDGMLTGTNIELYKKILLKYPGIKLIASGGVKDINDIKALQEIEPYAVVVGKAIYED